jgi:hypothetical protein
MRAGLEAVEDRFRQLSRLGARHIAVCRSCFGEYRTEEKGAVGTDRGRGGTPPGREDTGHESAVLTGRAVAPGAGTAKLSRHFADMSGGKVRVIEDHRPVDQPDNDLGPALATFHQSGEPDQIQRIHGASHKGLR